MVKKREKEVLDIVISDVEILNDLFKAIATSKFNASKLEDYIRSPIDNNDNWKDFFIEFFSDIHENIFIDKFSEKYLPNYKDFKSLCK